jgi:hypothetical protein
VITRVLAEMNGCLGLPEDYRFLPMGKRARGEIRFADYADFTD